MGGKVFAGLFGSCFGRMPGGVGEVSDGFVFLRVDVGMVKLI